MWILLRWPKMYLGHLRIPVARLVAEMDAGFQHLTHRDGHCYTPVSGLNLDPRCWLERTRLRLRQLDSGVRYLEHPEVRGSANLPDGPFLSGKPHKAGNKTAYSS